MKKIIITVVGKDAVGILAKTCTYLAKENINISDLLNRSRGEYAYTMLDLDHPAPADIEEQLMKIDGVLRVRVIR